MTQAEAATNLDVSPMSITRLVRIGVILAEQTHPGMPNVIKQSELANARVQQAVIQLKESNNRPLSHDRNQLSLFENKDLRKDRIMSHRF